MILRSRNELAAALDAAISSGDQTKIRLIEWEAAWTDQPCFHCGGYFTNDTRAFFWFGHDQKIVMHGRCLIDWFGRAAADVQRAERGQSSSRLD
ncbi:hypothetical protein GA0070563_114181 [Micromonospora carbonacea]|uniref:Uncharacterized protein n=1 Tax=Micromonospora carbonacea TaxID=47853 RepID=A0A1C5AN05_9ACTN|nr:hypothetical protein GA0070563_114181 [Micromonospora carbonacea]